MNSTQNTQIQSQNTMQSWTRSIHNIWLPRQSHKAKKDAEIPDMQLNIYSIQTTANITDCMNIQELQQAGLEDEHLKQPKEHIIKGWPEKKDQIPQNMKAHGIFR